MTDDQGNPVNPEWYRWRGEISAEVRDLKERLVKAEVAALGDARDATRQFAALGDRVTMLETNINKKLSELAEHYTRQLAAQKEEFCARVGKIELRLGSIIAGASVLWWAAWYLLTK